MKRIKILLLLITMPPLPAPALADCRHLPGQPRWAQWPGCPGGYDHRRGNWHQALVKPGLALGKF